MFPVVDLKSVSRFVVPITGFEAVIATPFRGSFELPNSCICKTSGG